MTSYRGIVPWVSSLRLPLFRPKRTRLPCSFVRYERERERGRPWCEPRPGRPTAKDGETTHARPLFSPLPPPRQGERCTLRNVLLVPIVPMVPIEKRTKIHSSLPEKGRFFPHERRTPALFKTTETIQSIICVDPGSTVSAFSGRVVL